MRNIDAQEIHTKVRDMVRYAATHLPQDVEQALEKAREEESTDTAKEILDQLLENARLARQSGLPLCQDTGVAIFLWKLGLSVGSRVKI